MPFGHQGDCIPPRHPPRLSVEGGWRGLAKMNVTSAWRPYSPLAPDLAAVSARETGDPVVDAENQRFLSDLVRAYNAHFCADRTGGEAVDRGPGELWETRLRAVRTAERVVTFMAEYPEVERRVLVACVEAIIFAAWNRPK